MRESLSSFGLYKIIILKDGENSRILICFWGIDDSLLTVQI